MQPSISIIIAIHRANIVYLCSYSPSCISPSTNHAPSQPQRISAGLTTASPLRYCHEAHPQTTCVGGTQALEDKENKTHQCGYSLFIPKTQGMKEEPTPMTLFLHGNPRVPVDAVGRRGGRGTPKPLLQFQTHSTSPGWSSQIHKLVPSRSRAPHQYMHRFSLSPFGQLQPSEREAVEKRTAGELRYLFWWCFSDAFAAVLGLPRAAKR